MNMKALSTKVLPICAAVAMAFSVSSAHAATIKPTEQLFDFAGVDITLPVTGLATALPATGSVNFGFSIPGTFFSFNALTADPTLSFADFIDVHISTPSLVNGLFTSIDLGSALKLTNFHVNVFQGTTNLLAPANLLEISSSDCTGAACVPVAPSSFHKATLATTFLAPGDYTIQVLGKVTGDKGASWSGSLNLTPAPVPVPAAVWLLGSALTSVVVTGRRKASV